MHAAAVEWKQRARDFFFPDFYFLHYPFSPSHARREEEGKRAARTKERLKEREWRREMERENIGKRTSSRRRRLHPASIYIQIDLPWWRYFHTRGGGGVVVTLSPCAGHTRRRRYDVTFNPDRCARAATHTRTRSVRYYTRAAAIILLYIRGCVYIYYWESVSTQPFLRGLLFPVSSSSDTPFLRIALLPSLALAPPPHCCTTSRVAIDFSHHNILRTYAIQYILLYPYTRACYIIYNIMAVRTVHAYDGPAVRR